LEEVAEVVVAEAEEEVVVVGVVAEGEAQVQE
jgi:hypothetical protein